MLRMAKVPLVSKLEIGSSRRRMLGLTASSTAMVVFLAISNVFVALISWPRQSAALKVGEHQASQHSY